MEEQKDLDPQEALLEAPDLSTDVEHEPIEDDTEPAHAVAPYETEVHW